MTEKAIAMTKRRRIVLWGAIVFLAWNILTFFVVHRPSSDQQVPSDLLKKLEGLQSEVQRQMNNNEALLRDLKKQKDLLNRICKILARRWGDRKVYTKQSSPKYQSVPPAFFPLAIAMTKRRRIVLWGAIVFLAWNILTFFVVHRPSSDQQVPSDLLKKLEGLQSEVQRQMNNNEALLRDLKKQKDLLNRYRNGNTGVQMDQGGRVNNSVRITHRLQSPAGDVVIPVLVIACNRPTVRRSLDLLVKHRPSEHQFPIIVSQDCGHQETSTVIKSYGDKIAHYIQQPDLSDIPVPPNHKRLQGYYKISRHYKWALNQVFNRLGYGSVLIVEDDLDIAPDFFDYFQSTLPLLQQDSSLWCVSAWNDNGKEHMTDTNRQDLLYRTEFFPGFIFTPVAHFFIHSLLLSLVLNMLSDVFPDLLYRTDFFPGLIHVFTLVAHFFIHSMLLSLVLNMLSDVFPDLLYRTDLFPGLIHVFTLVAHFFIHSLLLSLVLNMLSDVFPDLLYRTDLFPGLGYACEEPLG
uniref:Alpha-1,3-mannosyl-glycoprotein 2-beta-N-acetylglucosaminyltransferase n=1 Tax=Branchiostoma floridae TaxID=7739 RepID=C3YDW1_BRAFL|eukprot:XP_002605570.1 hypothetical protein BRAFLDRAFT_94252 [Branchiostoma floridae]